MFETLEALRSDRHADLRFTPVSDFGFAAGYHLAPLGAAEVGETARHMPIVFLPAGSAGAGVPQALMALGPGRNDYVAEDRAWTGGYVPAHFRRYPFILGRLGGGSGEYALMIDSEAPHFAGEGDAGEPLFNADGSPTDLVARARDFARWFHGQTERAREQVRKLEEAGVLVDRQLTLTRGETEGTVRGLRLVDMDQVRALPDETLGEWVRTGVMDLVHAHLLSLGHIQHLDAEPILGAAEEGSG